MATKNEISSGLIAEDPLQREEFSDFALVLKNGRELKCHKVMLAQVSLVFRAMLRKDCVETQTNQMKVTEFELETLESFLDYIYADLEQGSCQDLRMDERDFDLKRLTPELLRMCHMYEVTNLQEKCVQYLLKNIADTNAVDIWSVAEMIGNGGLKEVALDYLWKKGDKLSELPGLKETYQSPQLVESLVNYMSTRKTTANDEDITVYYRIDDWGGFERKMGVKLNYTVDNLRLLINQDLVRVTLGNRYRCQRLELPGYTGYVEEEKTLASYNLTDHSVINCFVYRF